MKGIYNKDGTIANYMHTDMKTDPPKACVIRNGKWVDIDKVDKFLVSIKWSEEDECYVALSNGAGMAIGATQEEALRSMATFVEMRKSQAFDETLTEEIYDPPEEEEE